nr:FixH family protein [Verrucomicrobiota bacterium]
NNEEHRGHDNAQGSGRADLILKLTAVFDCQSIQTEAVGEYQFEIRGKKSELHVGQNPVEIRVTRTGAPTAVEKVSFELAMDMPGMAMRANAPLQKTAQPGVYRGSIKLDMQGEYNGQASVIGPAGEARKNFTVRVAQ